MADKICAVSGCPNNTVNTIGKGISFHNFPKNPEIRNLWLKALDKSEDWDPRKKLAVCSNHFTPDSYGLCVKSRNLKSVLGQVLSLKIAKVSEIEISNDGSIPGTSKEVALETDLSQVNHGTSSNIPLTTSLVQEEDCTMNLISSDDEDIFQEEPQPEPVGSSSSSTLPLGIESSSSYEPSISSTQESEEIESEDENIEGLFHETLPHLEDKYLVFVSQLLLLFKFCRRPDCQKPIVNLARRTSGSCLTINTQCLDGHKDTWESQPRFGLTAWGNYLLAASLFFAGEIPSKFLRVFKNLKIRIFSTRMYFTYQRMFHLLIEKLWVKEQETLLLSDVTKKFTLCGDGRADSPGFSAKYGTYTFMDAETNKILHIELVQSTEVTSSNQMELEGLKRGLEFFTNMMIVIAKIVSDRNQGVIAYLRDKHPQITHEFDNWHVAKNIKSKLVAIGKKKDYEAILWIPGITNHIYWIGFSSTSREERKQKWLSLLNHITNVHEGHGSEFPKCLHGPIEEKDQRVWLSRGTKLFEEVCKTVYSPYTLAAIYQLSSKYQTYSVEVFHSVLNSFCPKMYHFTKDSMKSRISLAALHYNENGKKEQAVTAEGEEQYYISYSKAKAGTATVRKILVESTYGYVDKLMELAYEQAINHPVAFDLVTSPSKAATLSSFYFKEVSKADLVSKLCSRFK